MSTATEEIDKSEAMRQAAIDHRIRAASAMRRARAADSEIGKLPPVANPARRASCERDLLLFLTTYFPNSAGLKPYGPAQIQAIKRIEAAVLASGRTINLLPRGYSKSTISELACIWATLYRHREFVIFLAANEEQASTGLDGIKSELANNDLLLADFPNPCFALRKMQGKHQRARSLSYEGRDAECEWTARRIVLPTIGSEVGCVISSDGILSASRGSRFSRPDGTKVRPQLAILDDIETEQSATSASDIRKRLKIITNSILRMGGHGKQVSVVVNATQINDTCLIAILSDRKKHPSWTTTRAKTVIDFPTNMELWTGPYADILRDFDDESDPLAQRAALDKATAFYRDHWEEMNLGAKTSWEDIPVEDGEISAIQHALNILLLEGEDVFATEVQNEGGKPEVAQHLVISHAMSSRTNGLPEDVSPPEAGFLSFFIDVHDEVLYWARAALKQDFTGSIIQYGSWPKQPISYFMHTNIKRTLSDHYESNVEDSIRLGVSDLIKQLSSHDLQLGVGLIDGGYQPDLVSDAIRLARTENVFSSKGLGITPVEKPMAEYDLSPKRCLRAGPDPTRPRWYFPREFWKRVHFDANWWKSFTADRLTQSAFNSGAVTLWGDHERVDHSMINDHCMSERPVEMAARGRVVNVWRRSNRENHYWDCIVGCMVAASIAGCELQSVVKTKPRVVRRPAPRRNYGASDLNC